MGVDTLIRDTSLVTREDPAARHARTLSIYFRSTHVDRARQSGLRRIGGRVAWECTAKENAHG